MPVMGFVKFEQFFRAAGDVNAPALTMRVTLPEQLRGGTMLLYDSAVSGNCYKVRLLFAKLGVDYQRRELSVVDRSDRDAILGGLNPALRVPTLAFDDGRVLAESNAIIFFFARAAGLAAYWEEALHSLKGLPHVVDLRNLGLVAGVELESIAGKPGARGFDVFLKCYESGLLVRSTGDILALSPPLIIEKPQIDEIFGRLGEVLKAAA